MAKNKVTTIYQHILEVRLKSLKPSFIDDRGKLTEFLLKKLPNVDKFRISQDRIDILNKKDNINYFITVANFGLQIENLDSWQEFKTIVSNLFDILSKNGLYTPEDFVRIGLKTQLMTHKKGQNFELIKEAFEKKLFNLSDLETNLRAKVTDVGFPINFESKDSNFNIIAGPMKKQQALEQYFTRGNVGYDSGLPDSGIFFSIDYYQLNPSIKKLSDIKSYAISSIDKSMGEFKLFIKWLEK